MQNLMHADIVQGRFKKTWPYWITVLLVLAIFGSIWYSYKSSSDQSDLVEGLSAVKKSAIDRCGASIHLVMVLVSLSEPQTNYFFFTSGICGKEGEIIDFSFQPEGKHIGYNIQTHKNPDQKYEPIPENEWFVSYQEALNIALLNGGQKFMDANPGTRPFRVSLSNEKDASFIWEVIFTNTESRPKLIVLINPSNSRIISANVVD